MVDQRLGLESLARDAVDAVQEHLVKSLLVHCLARLSRQLLQLLHLLAVELLEVDGGGRRRGRRRRAPKLGNHGICKGGGKLEVGAGVVESEVDGGLHFSRWGSRALGFSVADKNPFSENGSRHPNGYKVPN